MVNTEGDAGSRVEDGPPDELSRLEYLILFAQICQAMGFDALRLKPREKQFLLILASESLGEGSAFGYIDIAAWRLRLAQWRSNELKAMFEDCRRAGWLTVDVTENTYRLAPDQFPGWGNVQAMLRSERRQRALTLMTEDDLHKFFAKISQVRAVCAPAIASGDAKISQSVTKFSQSFTKISQPGEPTEGNVQTFNRSDVKRLNVKRGVDCENFATEARLAMNTGSARSAAPRPDQVDRLRLGVREFVGEKDWTAKEFWNCGEGWRARLFIEEYRQLEGALAYCKSALQERDSGVTVKKTKGAMLWDEFQRLRRQAVCD